jgi:hypothetical protein
MTGRLRTRADVGERRSRVGGGRLALGERCHQRVHLEPNIAALPLEKVSRGRIEAMATVMLDDGLAPRTVRNVLTFTHSVFEHVIAKGWCHENPAPRRSSSSGDRRESSSSMRTTQTSLAEAED